VVFCIQTFCSLFFVADYYINTATYAANCINKDKPKMQCNGKCQLQKKINTADTNDKQSPERKIDTQNEVLSSKTFFTSVEILFKPFNKEKYIIINTGVPIDRSSGFFHPPKPEPIIIIASEA
jgi:hypothetical protein